MERPTIQSACRGLAAAPAGLAQADLQFVSVIARQTHDDWSPLVLDSAHHMLRRYAPLLLARGVDVAEIRQPIDEYTYRRSLRPVVPGRTVSFSGGLFEVCFGESETLGAELKAMVPHVWRREDEDKNPTGPWLAPAYRPETAEALCVFLTRHHFSGAEVVAAQYLEREKRRRASRASNAALDIPGLGGVLLPFQRAGVAYGVRARRVLLADQPGLGKTPQGLAIVEAIGAYPLLLSSPPQLKDMWEDKAREWLPRRSVQLIRNGGDEIDLSADIVIVSHDILHTEELDAACKLCKYVRPIAQMRDGACATCPPADVERKKRRIRRQLAGLAARVDRRQGWRGLLIDESHAFKNADTDRTRVMLRLARHFDSRILLTGTPAKSRPGELMTQLEILGVLEAEFGGMVPFGLRYCQATRDRFGWNFQGADNVDELRDRLRSTCMIRRLKSQVLKDLPPVRHSRVILEITNRAEYDRASEDFLEWLRQNAGAAAAEKAGKAEEITRIGRLKQLAARGKLAAAKAWVQRFADAREKLVLFAHHQDVQQMLVEAFPGAVAIRGGASKSETKEAKERFQDDPACWLIVCSLLAGGVGHTLTAASHVAFHEFGWTPADMDQGVGRIDRIGQKRAMNAWYLTGRGTIDEEIEALLAAKRAVTEAITDETARSRAEQQSVADDLIRRWQDRVGGRVASPAA